MTRGRRLRSLRLGCVALVLLLMSGAACSTLTITLLADGETNQGRPLQVVVRSTSRISYRAESYATLEKLLITPDSTVLSSVIIYPRAKVKRKVKVAIPAEKRIGVYVLFTDPAGPWKLLLEPKLPLAVTVPLGKSSIRINDIKECRLPFSSQDPEPEGTGGASSSPISKDSVKQQVTDKAGDAASQVPALLQKK